MDKRVFNISNYRQAGFVVVVVAAAAGQLFADDAYSLPHQAVNGHVSICGPGFSDPFGYSSAV